MGWIRRIRTRQLEHVHAEAVRRLASRANLETVRCFDVDVRRAWTVRWATTRSGEEIGSLFVLVDPQTLRARGFAVPDGWTTHIEFARVEEGGVLRMSTWLSVERLEANAA